MYLDDSIKIGEAMERSFEEQNMATLGYDGHINCFNRSIPSLTSVFLLAAHARSMIAI
jgi:hypothetical protein